MPEPTVPDLRTAARDVADFLTSYRKGRCELPDLLIDIMFDYAAELRSALANTLTVPEALLSIETYLADTAPSDADIEAHTGCPDWWADIRDEFDALRAALAAEATEPPRSLNCQACGHLAHTDRCPHQFGPSSDDDLCGCGPAPDPQGDDEPVDGEDALRQALTPFGWTCGPEFWQRYYSDPWVFNLANAVERLARRAAAAGAPDEPTDDDLTELRRLLDAPPPKDNAISAIARKVLPGLLAEVERLRAAAPASEDDERKPWTFDVQFEGGPQRVDYGTGTEWDGAYHWAIYDGPHELDDVVLSGVAEEDPTAVLAALVAEHNRPLDAEAQR